MIIIYSVKIIKIVPLQNVKCFRWVILRKKFCYQYLNKFVWLSLSTSTQKNSHKRILILLTLLHTISKLINITRESLRAICIESIANIIFTKKKKDFQWKKFHWIHRYRLCLSIDIKYIYLSYLKFILFSEIRRDFRDIE